MRDCSLIKKERHRAAPPLCPWMQRKRGAKHQERFNKNAQRLVKWTIWLLLGAVLIGTVLGTLLVSLPMEDSAHAPGDIFELSKMSSLNLLKWTLQNEGSKIAGSRFLACS